MRKRGAESPPGGMSRQEVIGLFPTRKRAESYAESSRTTPRYSEVDVRKAPTGQGQVVATINPLRAA